MCECVCVYCCVECGVIPNHGGLFIIGIGINPCCFAGGEKLVDDIFISFPYLGVAGVFHPRPSSHCK